MKKCAPQRKGVCAMNARILRLAVLIGTPLFMLGPSNAEEPKAAGQTTQRTKSYTKTEALIATVSKDTREKHETLSQPSVNTTNGKVPEIQIRQMPLYRPASAQSGEMTVSPLRQVAISPSKSRTLPPMRAIPQNPFQQPAVAIPTAAIIGGLPIQYASPGVQAGQLEKAQFPLILSLGLAPRAPTAPRAPPAPKAPRA